MFSNGLGVGDSLGFDCGLADRAVVLFFHDCCCFLVFRSASQSCTSGSSTVTRDEQTMCNTVPGFVWLCGFHTLTPALSRTRVQGRTVLLGNQDEGLVAV